MLEYQPVPVTVLERDAEGQPRFVVCNAAACKAGNLNREDVLGKTAIEAFGGAYGSQFYAAHVKAFKGPDVVLEESYLLLEGQKRTIRTILSPVPDKSGAIARVIGMPVDVTTELELKEAEEKTKVMIKEMENFINFAAHDLRSPMQKVRSIAAVLRAELPGLTPANMRLIELLESVATKSFKMITDLISHAQASDIASGETLVESFSLRDVSETILHTIDPEQAHNWTISDIPIVGERVVAQIVIRNLLDNAIKHNSDVLQLSVSASHADPGYYEIAVSDNGHGFSEDGKNHIKNGRFSAEGGFGLSSVRRLVASRNGSLSVDEHLGREGATIRVRLPGSVATGSTLNTVSL